MVGILEFFLVQLGTLGNEFCVLWLKTTYTVGVSQNCQKNPKYVYLLVSFGVLSRELKVVLSLSDFAAYATLHLLCFYVCVLQR